MPVLYNERQTPLAKNPSNTAFSNGILLGWDFTGHDSAHTNGTPWIFQGATSPTLTSSGTQSLVTINGEPGRVPAAGGSLYDYNPASSTDYGWQVGTGDFTIGVRISTPSTAPTTSNLTEILRVSGTVNTAISLNIVENPNNGWYLSATAFSGGPVILGTSQAAVTYPPNTTFMVWVRKISGVTTVFTQNVTTQGNVTVRYAAGASSAVALDAGYGKRSLINFTSASTITQALHSITFWNVGHSDSTLNSIGKNYWDTQANTAVATTIAITSPTTGSSISSTSVISGTYTGTPPVNVEVKYGSNAYVPGVGATIGGGTWSASFTLASGSANTLTARYTDNTSVISSDITNITVTGDAIAFTIPPTTTDGAVPYRMFQRNGSNQASVRVTGTYTGTVTSLQYRWDGGAWATLVASPAGGVFDATVTLTGPGQGSFDVRFANNVAVVGSLASIGVGDVYLVAGQSNHVGGGAGTYVPAVAPPAHNQWVASILDKTGRWRENVETVTDPFSKTTNASIYPAASATYAVQASSPTAYNSYFGKLATLLMASGIPVAFVPCALGSTEIASWSASTSTSTLYGAMRARGIEIGDFKAVLWWQGEANTHLATTRSSYEASLNSIINDWCVTQFPGSKWILMNLNSTGNGVGTGGSGPSDTGFNAIHAAIENVAATNSNVSAIADMNGTFSSSVHYATAQEINNIAAKAYSAIVGLATKVVITFEDRNGNLKSNLSNFKWALFEQTTPNNFLSPVFKGASATTSASGVMIVDITGTTLTIGSTGYLVVSNTDGTVGQNGMIAFAGPVTVS